MYITTSSYYTRKLKSEFMFVIIYGLSRLPKVSYLKHFNHFKKKPDSFICRISKGKGLYPSIQLKSTPQSHSIGGTSHRKETSPKFGVYSAVQKPYQNTPFLLKNLNTININNGRKFKYIPIDFQFLKTQLYVHRGREGGGLFFCQ